MTLPAVLTLRAMTPVEALRAAITFVEGGGKMAWPLMTREWLADNLEESECVMVAMGRWVKTKLIAERERMDRESYRSHPYDPIVTLRDKHPGLSDVEVMRPFGGGGL